MKILITGGAGFIGSNLAKALLIDKRVELVRVLDNLSNGYYKNISELIESPKFEFIEGDIRNIQDCEKACSEIDVISHQAALGSVPRSIKDPFTSFETNVMGTINIFNAAVKNEIKRIILACSSSTYGDSQILPKSENVIGKPLSPYAVTKASLEQIAHVWKLNYDLDFIGLRYFNIFGPNQFSNNPYAAVIPIFINSALNKKPITIFGDGLTSRDFTYISNAVHANILSIFTDNENALNNIYNVACGEAVSLTELANSISKISGYNCDIIYSEERKGDVKHSLADISKIKNLLGYEVKDNFNDGLQKTYNWNKNL